MEPESKRNKHEEEPILKRRLHQKGASNKEEPALKRRQHQNCIQQQRGASIK
jgi:hypothetical protein